MPSETKPPSVPQVIAAGSSDPSASVRLDAADPSEQQSIDAGQSVSVSSPVEITVTSTAGGNAHGFVFDLVRDGQVVYQADRVADIGSARIRLQPRTASQPGLLPGIVTLWVWGVDSSGGYSAPISATFDVAQEATTN